MATRPSAYLDWTDGSPTKVVQPPSTFQLEGWDPGQAPPAEYMNWLFWAADQWIQWFDEITYNANLQVSISSSTTGAVPVRTYLCDVSAGSITFTLMAAATAGKGYRQTVKNISIGSNNTVSVAVSGADNVESQTTDSLSAGDVRTYESDGVSKWWAV